MVALELQEVAMVETLSYQINLESINKIKIPGSYSHKYVRQIVVKKILYTCMHVLGYICKFVLLSYG